MLLHFSCKLKDDRFYAFFYIILSITLIFFHFLHFSVFHAFKSL